MKSTSDALLTSVNGASFLRNSLNHHNNPQTFAGNVEELICMHTQASFHFFVVNDPMADDFEKCEKK